MHVSRELLFDNQDGSAISFQVIQEFVNVCYKKDFLIESQEILTAYLENELYPRWTVNPSASLYNYAIQLRIDNKFSFYDSLIVASALEARCNILYTEDLQHGQIVETLRIVNPYL